MENERRKTAEPVPINFMKYLTNRQFTTLSELEIYGWELVAIRKSWWTKPIVLVRGPLTEKVIVLTDDGTLDYSARTKVRESINDEGYSCEYA